MRAERTVILGGGLSGMAAALALADAGWRDVTVVEARDELGGLAGTFEQGNHFYPLAYHHILQRDRTLLYFLETIGALSRVSWRKIRMLFRVDGELYDLANPLDFVRFPMTLQAKVRFVALMLRCFRKKDWEDWNGRSASELIDAWGGRSVREQMFEPLARIKFGLPCKNVSASWLGKRLYFREGSTALGYIPSTNWTKVLCEGITELLRSRGVQVLLDTRVVNLQAEGGRIRRVDLDSGSRLDADVVVNTLPTETYASLVPEDRTPGLDGVRYTAITSAVCVTRQEVNPDFYWMNLLSPRCAGSGLFVLSSLNPTIGGPGETCLNFMTHVPSREAPFFRQTDEELLAAYSGDFESIFGFPLEMEWCKINRLALYSPVFHSRYVNPPVASTTWGNLFFAGNYRTYPSIASTGTALGSGLEAAQAILQERGGRSRIFHEAADRR